jgi:hypothetical protein
VSASPEPISPELALVCPELRARALAALPPFPPSHARARSAIRFVPVEAEGPAARDVVAYVIALATQLGTIGAGVVALTLALTAVATLLR